MPLSSPADQPFRVSAALDKEQAAHLMSMRVVVQEPETGKSFEKAVPAETNVAFDIPAGVASSGQIITVRLDAMDEHDNRLASVERQVRIEGASSFVALPESRLAKPAPTAPAPEAAVEERVQAQAALNEKKAAGEAEEGEAAASGGDEVWNIPHGSKKYTAVRAETPPVIDGLLDDPIWQLAPRDSRFLSTRSKPFGQPTTEPTTVQVAYDEKYVYVAFRCTYSKSGAHDDSFAGDETTLLAESESVSVIIDAVHGHTGAYQFVVSPVGARGDTELSDQGSAQNLDWHRLWDVETHLTHDGWTAEFRIPWGTMRMPSHNDDFDLGINFSGREPISGEYSIWAPHPPATEIFDTTFFAT